MQMAFQSVAPTLPLGGKMLDKRPLITKKKGNSKCKTPGGVAAGGRLVDICYIQLVAYQQQWATRLSWRQRASPTVGTLFGGLGLICTQKSIHLKF